MAAEAPGSTILNCVMNKFFRYLISVFSICLLAQSFCFIFGETDASKSPTLIIGAVPWEMAPVAAELTESEAGAIHNIPFRRGNLYGMPVVVALTGVSKTNTGMVAGALITAFNPSRVIFSGTGAQVRSEIKAGYVFIIEETTFHDAGNLTEDGY